MRQRAVRSPLIRSCLLAGFLLMLGYAQVQDALRPDFAARVEVVVQRADNGEIIPARVYLFKGGQPFRLSPVDAHLPLRADLFYRERIWHGAAQPKTLEVTAKDVSHFILLEGKAGFDLPRSRTDLDEKYRLEAYHGTFYKPAVTELTLAAGENRRVTLRLEPIAPGRQEKWLAADDHIHLTRAKEDDEIFLGWLQAEDLAVGNFLELQRQQHASVQHAFGNEGEARRAGYSIRAGQESRSAFYGHVLLLGPERIVPPLSIGIVYANSGRPRG